MLQEISLSELPLGKAAVVKRIDGGSALTRRIISLGVTVGSEITPIIRAPFGDPTAYSVKGCLLALRKSDCAGITVAAELSREDEKNGKL